MAGQIGKDVLVAYKPEATFNTPPGAADGFRLRLNPSPGLKLARATILPGEIRTDGQTPMARMGSRSVTGSFNGDLSVNAFDRLIEAVVRGTWQAAVTIDQTDMTSITTTASTIVAAAGSWLTEGVRVGDVVRLSGHASAGNNARNLRVTAVSASTITVADTLTENATPDSDFTLTVLRKLRNAASPTRRSFYFEQYNQTIDQSQVFGGCRVGTMTIRGAPDGMATVEFSVVGSSGEALATGASPYFTSPAVATRDGLTFVDARIRLGTQDIAIATAFELTLTVPLSGLPIIGGTFTPDVFDEEMAISGSVSLLRRDLSHFEAFEQEQEFELAVLLEEPSGAPAACLSIFVPRLKRTDVDAQLGSDGGMIETIPFIGGKKEGATGYDDTMITFCTETPA